MPECRETCSRRLPAGGHSHIVLGTSGMLGCQVLRGAGVRSCCEFELTAICPLLDLGTSVNECDLI